MAELRSTEIHASGRSKEDVYKWTSTVDEGEFERVDKNLLYVDPAYQRTDKVSENRVIKIAREWNWIACGVLVVVRRMSGALMVVDGLHRLSAAKKRACILTLPCLIFNESDLSQEAKAFLNININRGSMSGLSKFKAMVASGDPLALSVKEMVESTGYRFHNSTVEFSVKCVMLLVHSYETNPKVCEKVWRLMAEIHQGQAVIDIVFQGAFRLEVILNERFKTSLFEPENVTKLMQAGSVNEIRQEIGKARAYYKTGGENVFAQGFINFLNYRRRDANRIPSIL